MILNAITVLTAISISITAAYFSIIGLATMFPGAQGAIILMGSVLEVGKIIAALWLHGQWNNLSRFVKIYLTSAVVVLMFITSMGIFGFLSKSYVIHEAQAEKEAAKLTQIERKIERQQFIIAEAQKIIDNRRDQSANTTDKITVFIKQEEERISKLNNIAKESIAQEESNINRWKSEIQQLNQTISDLEKKSGLFSNNKKKIEAEQIRQAPIIEGLNKKISGAEDSIQKIKTTNQSNIKEITDKIKELQNSIIERTTGKSEDADKAQSKIDDAQKIIDELSLEKFDYENSVRELEVEVGPVKYIVEMIGDFFDKSVSLGTAVRWVIICLIFVFDPLAVVLIVVSVHALTASYGKIKKVTALEEEVAKAEEQLKTLESDYQKHINKAKSDYQKHIDKANKYMSTQNKELKKNQYAELNNIEEEILSRKTNLESEIKKLKKLQDQVSKSEKGLGRNHWNQ